MKNTLEGSTWFPYVAWTTVMLFAFFTYTLLSGIKESIAYLDAQTQENTKAINEYIVVKRERSSTTPITVQKLP